MNTSMPVIDPPYKGDFWEQTKGHKKTVCPTPRPYPEKVICGPFVPNVWTKSPVIDFQSGCYDFSRKSLDWGKVGRSKFEVICGTDSGAFHLNEKATMQMLNDRLAAYLEKVHSLQTANEHLEIKIREYYEKKGPAKEKDCSKYLAIICELREKITSATTINASLLLKIDNARLAAEDFKIKFEQEHLLYQSVLADVTNLRRMRDQLIMMKTDLELQIKSLHDELVCLKKYHIEEVTALRCKLTGKISVEVDAAPQPDLARILEEIRAKYEAITCRYREEQHTWFTKKTSCLKKDVDVKTETIQTSKTEICELRSSYQSLQIELQSQISLRVSLETRLRETEAHYSFTLCSFQKNINLMEAGVSDLHSKIEYHRQQYTILFDIKVRLEHEIATYRSLLEEQECRKIIDGGTKQVIQTTTKIPQQTTQQYSQQTSQQYSQQTTGQYSQQTSQQTGQQYGQTTFK